MSCQTCTRSSIHHLPCRRRSSLPRYRTNGSKGKPRLFSERSWPSMIGFHRRLRRSKYVFRSRRNLYRKSTKWKTRRPGHHRRKHRQRQNRTYLSRFVLPWRWPRGRLRRRASSARGGTSCMVISRVITRVTDGYPATLRRRFVIIFV